MYIAAKSPIMSIMHQIVPAMTFANRRVPFLTGRVWVRYPSSEYVTLIKMHSMIIEVAKATQVSRIIPKETVNPRIKK